MLSWLPGVVGLATSLALIGLGGGLYEVLVVDPAWPRRLDLIQPQHGGVSRKRFWIPAHSAFELSLIAALVVGWPLPAVRTPLLVALGSHGVMRVWSFAWFIPHAAAFELASPAQRTAAAASVAATSAQAAAWCRASRWRLPIDLLTAVALLTALLAAARVGQ